MLCITRRVRHGQGHLGPQDLQTEGPDASRLAAQPSEQPALISRGFRNVPRLGLLPAKSVNLPIDVHLTPEVKQTSRRDVLLTLKSQRRKFREVDGLRKRQSDAEKQAGASSRMREVARGLHWDSSMKLS